MTKLQDAISNINGSITDNKRGAITGSTLAGVLGDLANKSLGQAQPGTVRGSLDGGDLVDIAISTLTGQGSTGTTGSVIGGHKALVSIGGLLSQASAGTPAHFGKLVGISLNAALAGAQAQYATGGTLDDPSFNFSEGPVYLGLNGVLTQTYPSTDAGFAFAQQVGTATSTTRIVIAIQPPVLLA